MLPDQALPDPIVLEEPSKYIELVNILLITFKKSDGDILPEAAVVTIGNFLHSNIGKLIKFIYTNNYIEPELKDDINNTTGTIAVLYCPSLTFIS